MTILWHESPESRSGSLQPKNGQRVFEFVCIGTSSDYVVYNTALSQLSTFDSFGFVLSDIGVTPITTGSTDDDFSWRVSATYSHPESDESQEAISERATLDTCRYEFDAGADTGHITHALHQKEYPGELVDDAGLHKRAIEATYEGDVRGIDIPVPSLGLTIWKIWPRALWRGGAGIANAKMLAGHVGKTNGAAWWGFDRGELQFLGARPEEIGIWATKITYLMKASKNVANLDFGEMATGAHVNVPLKRGHEYVWVYHKRMSVDRPGPAGGGTTMIAKPWSVQVAQVFDEINFNVFGLPNAPP